MRTGSAGEQLVEENLDGVEPVKRLGVGAICRALALEAFTKVPQSDRVEIVQTDGPGNRVDDDGIRDGSRKDVGEVEFNKIDAVSDARVCAGLANLDENKKDDGQ